MSVWDHALKKAPGYVDPTLNTPYLNFIMMTSEQQWQHVDAGLPLPECTEQDQKAMDARLDEGERMYNEFMLNLRRN